MTRHRMLIAASLAALSLTLPAGATGPEDEFTLPTYAGAYQPQGVDEQGQWLLADESERTIRDLPVIIRDEALNAYVRSVLCRAVGSDRCNSARIYILRMPEFNASMSANGTMFVFSGLLLRVRNEAELASVLAHEFAHFELRHSLQRFRRQRSASDALAWASLAAGITQSQGVGYGPSFQELYISIHGSLAAYNRNDERSADIRSFAYTTASRFRPSAASDVWRSVMNEADAAATARGRPTSRFNNVAFFASHPTNLERADTLSLLANRVPGAGDYDGRESYRAAIAPWLHQFLSDQLRLNDFGASEFLIGRLASEGWTAPLHFARGELYRMRGHPRDLVSAAEFYRAALELDANLVDARRGLGLALIRSGNVAEGRTALTAYLDARPDAPDAAMLRSLLSN